MTRYRPRWVARSRVCYTAWAIKPTYVFSYTWGLPGRASIQKKVYRRISREEVIKMVGQDLEVGELIRRY